MKKPKYCISYHWLIFEDKYREDLAVWENLAGAMQENLRMMEEYGIRASFELSAAEAIDLKERYPELFDKIKLLINQNKADLVEGSYSQPHFHLISGESNIRQFEYGDKRLREMFGKEINIFLRQEAGHHAQLPQILNKFGFTCALPVSFGMLIYRYRKSPIFIDNLGMFPPHGVEMVNWVGLDGSKIPFYMVKPRKPEEALKSFFESNSFRRDTKDSPIYYSSPDHNSAPHLYHLLDLKKELEFCPISQILGEFRLEPQGEVEIFSGSGYAFGKLGELGKIANRKAEEKLIQAEKLTCLADFLLEDGLYNQEKFDGLWERLLASQHHDNWWINTKVMEEEGARSAEEVSSDSEILAEDSLNRIANLVDVQTEGIPLLVFNSLSWPRQEFIKTKLRFDSPCKNLSVVDESGNPVQSITYTLEKNKKGEMLECELAFWADIPSFGYRIYSVRQDYQSLDNHRMVTINHFGDYLLIDNGIFEFKFDKVKKVITGIKSREKDIPLENLGYLKGQVEGKELNNDTVSYSLKEGVFPQLYLTSSNDFGKIDQILTFYPNSPFIDIETLVNIEKLVNIGEFEKEETPLRITLSLKEEAQNTVYDIPFGFQPVLFSSRFFPLKFTWLQMRESDILFMHKGTNLHYLRGKELSNILICANKEWAINLFRGKPEDMRFLGTRKFHHRVWFGSKLNSTEAFQRSGEYQSPLIVKEMQHQKGKLASKKSFLEINDSNLLLSTIFKKNGHVFLRLWESSGSFSEGRVRFCDSGKIFEADLIGEKILSTINQEIVKINPWEIKTLEIEK